MIFTHLHTHSHYSLLEAIPQISPLVKTAKKFGMKSLALTDTNNLYGAIEFYKECKKAEIKPIIGAEISVAEKSMWEEINTTTNRIFKMVVLCENLAGYKNLLKLISRLHTEPKEKLIPCVDIKMLEEYKEGLVVLSGLNESYLWEKARTLKVSVNNFEKTTEYEQIISYLKNVKNIFGERFFIEIGNLNEVEDGKTVRENSIKLARELEIEIVAAYNSHYIDPTDRSAQKTIFAISNELENKARFKRVFEKGYYFLASESDAKKHFADIPEAIENTQKIAEMCNLEIELGKWVFPKFETESGKSYYDELKDVTYEGFKRRGLEQSEALVKRVEYELSIIEKKGFTQYLLIVADLLRYARDNKIATNIRGSVSGSLVTYLSGITNIDPIHFEIPFERFLNPDRPSAPDIDMDYEDTRRDEMVEYVKMKYGAERVAQIGTFGTMAARAACRDVARAMGYPYVVGDKISKAVPPGSQGFPMTLERALNEDADFKKLYDESREVKEVVDTAMKIEGNARHMGVHAAGIVISPTTLDEYTPIQYDPKGERKVISQYDMYTIEEAGLIKFDFLGLSNLRIISDTLKLVKQNYNIEVDLDNIPLDDKLTFEKLGRGETVDLFQLNGSGMTKFLMELKPTIVNDINAMVALYRPGPLAYIPEYIKRKNNPELVSYMHPSLEPILNKTFGVLVYQDDLLMMALNLAGYSWGEVDKFRKAVGKKIPEEMQKQKEQFIAGCVSHAKFERKLAENLWEWIEPFSAYGFNKAHSVSYGRVAYLTAYLKAHFPTEYMCAVLNAEEGEVDKISVSIKECIRLGIKVLPPNVNYSEKIFGVIKKNEKYTQDAIVFGLNTIKMLGSDAAEEIVKLRKNEGDYKSLTDFIKRIPAKSLNKKSVEALIKAGAWKDFAKRGILWNNVENILAYQYDVHHAHAGQMSLFGEMEEIDELKLVPENENAKIPRNEILKWEKEVLGVYLSGHPLDAWRDILSKREITISKINNDIKDGTKVLFAGIIGSVKTMLTKNKDKMAFVQVEDLDDSIECVVFPKTYAQFKDLIVFDTPLAVRGRVSLKNKEDRKEKSENENIENIDKAVKTDEPEKTEEEKNKYGAKSIIIEEIRKI